MGRSPASPPTVNHGGDCVCDPCYAAELRSLGVLVVEGRGTREAPMIVEVPAGDGFAWVRTLDHSTTRGWCSTSRPDPTCSCGRVRIWWDALRADGRVVMVYADGRMYDAETDGGTQLRQLRGPYVYVPWRGP